MESGQLYHSTVCQSLIHDKISTRLICPSSTFSLDQIRGLCTEILKESAVAMDLGLEEKGFVKDQFDSMDKMLDL